MKAGKTEQPRQTEVAGSPDASPAITVLVVESPSLFRDGLSSLLATEPDITVVATVESLQPAVDEVKRSKPDIALVGWPASSQESQRFFAAIQDSKAPTRVIMLTREDSKDDFLEAVRQGCCGIVPKQTSKDLLIKSIRKVKAGELWLDRMTTADVIRRLAKRATAVPTQQARAGLRDATALSQREMEIVILVAQGYKNKEMAERMFISEQTVKNHLHNIFDKLGVSDRLELALYAIHKGLHLTSDPAA